MYWLKKKLLNNICKYEFNVKLLWILEFCWNCGWMFRKPKLETFANCWSGSHWRTRVLQMFIYKTSGMIFKFLFLLVFFYKFELRVKLICNFELKLLIVIFRYNKKVIMSNKTFFLSFCNIINIKRWIFWKRL